MEGHLQPKYKIWVVVLLGGILISVLWASRIQVSWKISGQETITPTISVLTPTPTLPVVTRVVDGDTVVLSSGEKVRYIGINAPESVDPRKAVECFGREAAAENKRLVEGHPVTLVKDVSETDSFGRLLRYVYVDGVFINELLVRNGYARASAYPPDVKFQTQFQVAEREARTMKVGLWGTSCQ